MSLRNQLDLAVEISGLGPASLNDYFPLFPEKLAEFWAASKARLECWSRQCQTYAGPSEKSLDTEVDSLAILPVVNEILITEPLTRVWAAAVSAIEPANTDLQGEPVVRDALQRHLTARGWALRFIARLAISCPEIIENLHSDCRRLERWTDLLVARWIGCGSRIHEFAPNPGRAEDFHQEFSTSPGDVEHWWRVAFRSITSGMDVMNIPDEVNAEQNRRIEKSILASLGRHVTRDTPPPRTPCGEELDFAFTDIEGWLEAALNPTADDPRAIL